MVTVKETRIMEKSDLAELCDRRNWLTHATLDQREKFFNMTWSYTLHNYANMTKRRLLRMAQMVVDYSDPSTYDIIRLEGVISSLCDICHSCFTIADE